MVELPEDSERQTAKDAFRIHQDALFWSRAQTLFALQAGTLTGASLLKARPGLAIPLLALGVAVSVLLWLVAERDLVHRDAANEKFGLEPTLAGGDTVSLWLIRTIFILLFVADAYLFGWLLLAP